jgi:hypothetical protein
MKLRKIHDIETLITEAVRFNAEFQEYLDLGRRLTAYYYEERYPLDFPLITRRRK